MFFAGSEHRVLGYMVVRKPELSFDQLQRGAWVGGPPCRAGVCYSGIDRMSWFDIYEAMHASTLPADVRTLWGEVKASNDDFTGVDLCTSRTEALELLRFSNRSADRCELIAVAGDDLAAAKGLTGMPDQHVRWLGFDVMLRGGWSLIGDWLFRGSRPSVEWFGKLNEHGLLDSPYQADDLFAAYQRAADRGVAEEIPGPSYIPMVLHIGRVEAGTNGRS